MRATLLILLILGSALALSSAYNRRDSLEHSRMRAALSASGNKLAMSENELLDLADDLSSSGLGTPEDARDTVYWLVCTGRSSREQLDSAARLALVRVLNQGATPRQAVRDMSWVSDVGGRDPMAACAP